MSDQKRKAKQRKETLAEKRREAERRNIFIDGMDKYADEYARTLANPPLSGLFGAFELEDEQFYNQSLEVHLAGVGLGDHRILKWNSELSRKGHSPEDDVHGAGAANAVMTDGGRIISVVFLRKHVPSDSDDGFHDEFESVVKLLVLLHEVGHAKDMLEQINFKHDTGTVDIVSAEAFAHLFALRHLKKRNCRVAIQQYVQQLDKWIEGEATEEYVRRAAQKTVEALDFPAIRELSKTGSNDTGWKKDVLQARLIEKMKKEGTI